MVIHFHSFHHHSHKLHSITTKKPFILSSHNVSKLKYTSSKNYTPTVFANSKFQTNPNSIGSSPNIEKENNNHLHRLAKIGELDRGFRFLEHMSFKGQIPDVFACTILIGQFCKTGQTNKATRVMEILETSGAVPVVRAYNVLISGYCKSGEIDKALQHLERMSVSPDVVHSLSFALVGDKSRCDNRLNEIAERASADKRREEESLGKKYEEKYKQVAEIASKLTVGEAMFRDIQERKTELQQAIVKTEQGGSADGILQVRADRIQSDLEQLFKALAERCNKHETNVKSIAMVQLPDGWQPGNPKEAAVWDEDWDKFEDEGFANDLTFDTKNASSEPKPSSVPAEQNSFDDNSVYGSPVNANGRQEHFTNGDYTVEKESSYARSEDGSARSPRDSPFGRNTAESPSKLFSTAHFERSPEADAETHRSFDESTWVDALAPWLSTWNLIRESAIEYIFNRHNKKRNKTPKSIFRTLYHLDGMVCYKNLFKANVDSNTNSKGKN
ncbi:uncharacterized protein LOC123920654 [Trifolium pratense]|nr:uncharacterized protein LOC123920654 [Trifolium pratense]